jgi:hypothetical protein
VWWRDVFDCPFVANFSASQSSGDWRWIAITWLVWCSDDCCVCVVIAFRRRSLDLNTQLALFVLFCKLH